MYDRVEIRVRAGAGGDGEVSFRQEKFVPFGGPDGGDGGGGGDVILMADGSVTSLREFKGKRFYRAADGESGKSKKKHGKKGKSLILTVPVGTVVLYKTQVGGDAVIADLEEPGQQAVIAKGGEGNTQESGLGQRRLKVKRGSPPRRRNA